MGAKTLALELLKGSGTRTSVPGNQGGLLAAEHQTHAAVGPAERRRSYRLRLQMPMFLRAAGARGDEFLDLAKTLDISATGAYLACPRALRANDVVTLTIPAPPPSYSGVVPAGTPPIQGRVRRVELAGDVHLVGIEFLRPLD